MDLRLEAGGVLKDQTGRYHDIHRATLPGELPPEGKVNRNVAIAHGAVADPNPALRGKRQRVAINRMTDALEQEATRHRISQEAYWAGRCFQHIMEKSRVPVSGQGQWNPASRRDQVISHELAVLNKIIAAEDVVSVMQKARPIIGMLGERVLSMIILEGCSVRQVAERFFGTDASGDKVFFYGETFRQSLEALADHWTGRKANQASPRIRSFKPKPDEHEQRLTD